MAMRRVQCPAHLELGPAERAMLAAILLAADDVEAVMWCELDHDPTTGLGPCPTATDGPKGGFESGRTGGQHDTGQAPGEVLHVTIAQVVDDVWWLRWNTAGTRRELTALPEPCLTEGRNDFCTMPIRHAGRHSWDIDPSAGANADPRGPPGPADVARPVLRRESTDRNAACCATMTGMRTRDQLIALLRSHPSGLSDAEVATTLELTHQRANQLGRALVSEGLAQRDPASGTIRTRLISDVPVPAATDSRNEMGTTAATSTAPDRDELPGWDDTRDWSWEGNVQARVIVHLQNLGWYVISAADTASREQGIDIVAERQQRRLLVEVKGWPSSTYSRGDRAGQPNRTQPSLQASHWLAGALFSVMRAPRKDPHAALALALPDVARYRALLAEVDWALRRLDIAALLVDDQGTVSIANQPMTL